MNEYTQEIPQSQTADKPWHHEEETQNTDSSQRYITDPPKNPTHNQSNNTQSTTEPPAVKANLSGKRESPVKFENRTGLGCS